MSIGDTGAVADTGVADTGDTSVSDDSGADTSTSDAGSADSGSSSGAATTQQAAAEKLRLKWLGREEEIDDPRKLAERFSDEYEYEFKGPGGKPMKARWPDIERHVQLSAGAQERMREAQGLRQRIMDRIEQAKQNDYEGLPHALEEMFGVKDAEEYFFQRASQKLQREAELAQLAQTDPVQYHRRMEQMMRERSDQRLKFAESQRARQAQQEQQRRDGEAREGQMRGEIKNAGVQVNKHTVARAYDIMREAKELGMDLEPRQVAYELRKQLDAEILSHLDGMPPEKLLGYLGEGRRTKLREAELAATKAAQKAQRANGASNGSAPAAKKDDAVDKALRSFMRGG